MTPNDGRSADAPAHDVVVIGAGVAGCAIGNALAPDLDVLVMDRTGVAAEATGLSAGLVAPTLFYGDLPSAARHANAFFRSFDGTNEFAFTERHRLDLVTDGDDGRATAEERADDGFPVTYLDGETAPERFPYIQFDAYDGAVRYGDAGWVDPYSYTNALASTARRRGATLETGVAVTDLLIEDDAVSGVETDAGPRLADTVVAAAGWRTGTLLDVYCRVPVKPYRTQVVILEPDEELPADFPLLRVSDEGLYIRPEHNGDLLVGGGHYTIDDRETADAASRNADESFRMEVAETIPSLIDGFERAGFVNDWAGVDAGTADGWPVIDCPPDAPTGLVVATGFNGLGVMASPIAAAAVRELVTDDPAGFNLEPFRADRFSSSDDLEVHYSSEV